MGCGARVDITKSEEQTADFAEGHAFLSSAVSALSAVKMDFRVPVFHSEFHVKVDKCEPFFGSGRCDSSLSPT
jgi:hypothetical protein